MWLEQLRQDVQYAARSLRRSPSFALVAILTLGLGIGAATAICSVVNAILLQPLPFPDGDRLVRIVENYTVSGEARVFQRGVSYPNYLEWRARSTTLSGVTAFSARSLAVRTT